MTVIQWPHPRPGVEFSLSPMDALPSGPDWYRVLSLGDELLALGVTAGGFITAKLSATDAEWVLGTELTSFVARDYPTRNIARNGGVYLGSLHGDTLDTGGAKIIRSTDGLAWSFVAMSPSPALVPYMWLSGVGAGNGYFVIQSAYQSYAADAWVARSADGLTWEYAYGQGGSFAFSPAVWTGTLFFRVAFVFTIDSTTSTDGLVWSDAAVNSSGNSYAFGQRFRDGVFVSTNGFDIINSDATELYGLGVHTSGTYFFWNSEVFCQIFDGDGAPYASISAAQYRPLAYNDYTVASADFAYPSNTSYTGYLGAYGFPVGPLNDVPVLLTKDSALSGSSLSSVDYTLIASPNAYTIVAGDMLEGVVGAKGYPFVIAITVPAGAASVQVNLSFGDNAPAGYADFYTLDSDTFDYDGTYLDWIDVSDQPTATVVLPTAGGETLYLGVDPYTDSNGAQLNAAQFETVLSMFWTGLVNCEITA